MVHIPKSADELKVGDTVKMKGQNVKMTVREITKKGSSINCAWFTKNNELQMYSLPRKLLRRIPDYFDSPTEPPKNPPNQGTGGFKQV